ncbi:MAG: PH domain-containing protein [Xanthobacteraceae bacterium]|jgi:uncharacterized membrane protein YdbT with pleckstrin-like domain
MRYVDQVLQPGETIRQVTTFSRVGYWRGGAVCVVALVVWALTPTETSSPSMHLIGLGVAAVLVVTGAFLLLRAWWQRVNTEVAVTDRRVIYKTGFISRKTREMHMDKIVSVDVTQGILGRMLNYGDITINGSGQSIERIPAIDSPVEFRNHVTAN